VPAGPLVPIRRAPTATDKYIAGAKYCAGSAYRFVQVDRLTSNQRSELGGVDADPDIYAVLIPADGSTNTAKAIDRDTALLYLTLREPGPLPSFMRTTLRDDLPATVRRLVLDGILEIFDGGEFVSGPRAGMLLGTCPGSAPTRGRLAQLSVDALRYAQNLQIDDARVLALRLYCYNRRPITPAWARRLPTRAATADYLGVTKGETGPAPGPGWTSLRGPDVDDEHWLAWRSRVPTDPSGEHITYKLYVSPLPSAVPDALRISAEVLHELRAPAFKVGADLHGLLRPDKLVAYLTGFEQLAAAAAHLQDRLAGLPAHGVPFTAEISTDGLLSWGVDPPRRERGLTWIGDSWRLWVAGQLAAGLLAARSATDEEPWRYALERIRLEGLDPETWIPKQTLFAPTPGGA
jgi:hypothetical protein